MCASEIAQGNRQNRRENSAILERYWILTMLFGFLSSFPIPCILSIALYECYHLNVFSKKRKVCSPEQIDLSYLITKSSLSPDKLQNQGKNWSKRKMQQMTYTGMGQQIMLFQKKRQSNSRFLLSICKGRTADSSLLSLSLKKKLSKTMTHTYTF